MAPQGRSTVPIRQTAIIATAPGILVVSHDVGVPEIGDDMLLVKTMAVAINPSDAKMVSRLWRHFLSILDSNTPYILLLLYIKTTCSFEVGRLLMYSRCYIRLRFLWHCRSGRPPRVTICYWWQGCRRCTWDECSWSRKRSFFPIRTSLSCSDNEDTRINVFWSRSVTCHRTFNSRTCTLQVTSDSCISGSTTSEGAVLRASLWREYRNRHYCRPTSQNVREQLLFLHDRPFPREFTNTEIKMWHPSHHNVFP